MRWNLSIRINILNFFVAGYQNTNFCKFYTGNTRKIWFLYYNKSFFKVGVQVHISMRIYRCFVFLTDTSQNINFDKCESSVTAKICFL